MAVFVFPCVCISQCSYFSVFVSLFACISLCLNFLVFVFPCDCISLCFTPSIGPDALCVFCLQVSYQLESSLMGKVGQKITQKISQKKLKNLTIRASLAPCEQLFSVKVREGLSWARRLEDCRPSARVRRKLQIGCLSSTSSNNV